MPIGVIIGPGTKFTVTGLAKNPLAFALTDAEPVNVGDFRLTVAVPVLSVNADVADKVPALAVKFTGMPAPILVPVNVARITVLVAPSAVMDVAPGVRDTALIAVLLVPVKEIVRGIVPNLPFDAVAVSVSVAGAEPAW